jgi:hypothetical protein
MGSGVSSLSRLRKTVLIRAYNLRPENQSLIDQFMPFTFPKEGKGLYISIYQIKKCLKMDTPEYKWIEELLQAVFTVPTSPPTQKVPNFLFPFFLFNTWFNSLRRYIFMILYSSWKLEKL